MLRGAPHAFPLQNLLLPLVQRPAAQRITVLLGSKSKASQNDQVNQVES